MNKVNLSKTKLQVALLLDFSISVCGKYGNGDIQKILDRIAPIYLNFSGEAKLDVWLFTDKFMRLENLTSDNLSSYVQKNVLPHRYSMGDEAFYAPVLEAVYEEYTKNSSCPSYVVLVTSGDDSDKLSTIETLKKYLNNKSYLKLLYANTGYQEYLMDLEFIFPNVCFVDMEFILKTGEKELYNDCLVGYDRFIKFIHGFDPDNPFYKINEDKLFKYLPKPKSPFALSRQTFLKILPVKYLAFIAAWFCIDDALILYSIFGVVEVTIASLRLIDSNTCKDITFNEDLPVCFYILCFFAAAICFGTYVNDNLLWRCLVVFIVVISDVIAYRFKPKRKKA